MCRKKLEALFSLALAEELRIVNEHGPLRIRNGTGTRIDWSRKRSPARLIDANNDIQLIPGLDALLKEG
jgi:hypothetical protein